MWFLVVAMLVILVLAGIVVLYVAFPHRGEEVPAAPWLGDALRKGVESAPTLDNTAEGGTAAAHGTLDLADLDAERSESRGREA